MKPGQRRRLRRRNAASSPSEGTVSTTMRLRASLRKRLDEDAERARRSVSEVAQELMEEAIRMRDCPGIYFASEPSGRTAKVAGTGLAVWEVLRDFARDENLDRARESLPQLSGGQVAAAVMYFHRYRDEVKREVAANAALTAEELSQRYPGLIRIVRAE